MVCGPACTVVTCPSSSPPGPSTRTQRRGPASFSAPAPATPCTSAPLASVMVAPPLRSSFPGTPALGAEAPRDPHRSGRTPRPLLTRQPSCRPVPVRSIIAAHRLGGIAADGLQTCCVRCTTPTPTGRAQVDALTALPILFLACGGPTGSPHSHEAPVAQSAEATDSKPVQCRFESDRGHRTPPAVMPVGFRVSGCRVGQTSGTKTGRSEGTTFVRFGFISHVVGDDGDSARVLREAVELARIAEEAGFDSFWIAEHHFGVQRAHCPSPLILAAAVAEHTERL